MNKKGIFGMLIAAAAVFLVAATVISSQASIKTSGNDFSEKILELKKEWNNARYLLDKTAADALADNTDSSCIPNQSIVEQKINEYFDNTKSNSFKENCEYTAPVIPPINQGEVTVSITLTCTKSSGDFSANFWKNVFFEKKIELNSTGGCKVTDLQSNTVEIE